MPLIAERTVDGYIGTCPNCGQGADTLPGWSLCDGCFEQADEANCGEYCKCECPPGDYHLVNCKCEFPDKATEHRPVQPGWGPEHTETDKIVAWMPNGDWMKVEPGEHVEFVRYTDENFTELEEGSPHDVQGHILASAQLVVHDGFFRVQLNDQEGEKVRDGWPEKPRKVTTNIFVHIQANEHTTGGAVLIEGVPPHFRLRCTVSKCAWTGEPGYLGTAERMAADHATLHRSGGLK